MGATFEPRELVIPGDLIYEGRTRIGDNTYRMEGKVYASQIGLVSYGENRVSVIALETGFNPMVGDMVIGEVIDIELGQWLVDIGSPTEGVLRVPEAVDRPFYTDFDMTRVLDVGDTLVAKIVDMDRRQTPILSILGRNMGKANAGFIYEITPAKIPRLIGRKGSMINMILKETNTQITIGQNGRILINGRNKRDEEMVIKVINKIEKEAHTTGLTNRIQAYLKRLKEEEK
jgi:exosome complex component RRP4